jgi:hypothetical protein
MLSATALAVFGLGCGDDAASPPGPATRLGFADAPSHVTAGETFGVTVRAERDDGSVDAAYMDPVTLSVASGPGALNGTTTRDPVSGVAEFPGLTVTAEGTYALAATSAGLAPATSPAIESLPVSPMVRTGTFSGQNGYVTLGSVEVIIPSAGGETLRTGSDFQVSSGGGSISIWLTDAAGGANLRNTAVKVKLGTVTSEFRGVYTYPVPEAGSAGYTHVVTFCDGAQVNFGMAALSAPS